MFIESVINKVKIEKSILLRELKANLENHTVEIEELRVARRDEIEERLQDVLQNIEIDVKYQPEAQYHFPYVVDHSADYERAIAMIEMSSDDIIELEEVQFRRLVMDEWEWTSEFKQMAATYSGKVDRK